MKPNILWCALICTLFFSGCSPKGISGNEWLLSQSSACSDLEQTSLNMSDLFSLYFVGAIEAEDFSTELDLLSAQLTMSQDYYLAGKAEISPSTHSYASKSGEEALTSAYTLTLDLLETSKNLLQTSGQEQLVYEYLKWRELFITQLATYCTAEDLIAKQEEQP